MSPPRFTLAELASTAAGRLQSNQAVLGVAGKKRSKAEPKFAPSLPPSTYDAAKGVCTVILPLPPKDLRPNGRPGKWGRIKAVPAAREYARVSTIEALKGARPMWGGAHVFLTVYLTSRRASDGSNWVASAKAYEDGIADAGLVRNDSGNVWQPVVIEADRTCPRFELRFVRIGDEDLEGRNG